MKQDAQLTAVEWFNQQLVDRQNGNGDSRSRDEIFEQAKEMEKQNLKNLTKPLNHNKIKYLVISVIYVGFFAVIGLACYFTKSAIPLFGLILMPSFKSKSE